MDVLICPWSFAYTDFNFPSHFAVLVDQIKEVQSGKNSEALKNKDIECAYQEEYILTILYGNNYTSLDLVAKTPDEANVWIAGLSHLINRRDISSGRWGLPIICMDYTKN